MSTHKSFCAQGGKLEPIALSISDAARLCGISRSELYRLMGAGRLRAVKHGSRTLLPTAALREFVAALPAAEIRTGS